MTEGKKRPQGYVITALLVAVLTFYFGIVIPSSPISETPRPSTPIPATSTPSPPAIVAVTPSPTVPQPWLFLTEDQMLYVAGIVAGESANVYECYVVTACTILWDLEGGMTINELLPGRWYGWQEPGALHIQAVRDALFGACENLPRCAFLGNPRDVEIWQERGWVGDGEFPIWTDSRGLTSVCIPIERSDA